MMTSKLRSTPPTASLDDFVTGAEQRTAPEPKPAKTKTPSPGKPKHSKAVKDLPWEKPNVREDVQKVYNLRLPEPYLLKLKYISEHSSGSMHRFCLDALLPEIDKKIKDLM